MTRLGYIMGVLALAFSMACARTTTSKIDSESSSDPQEVWRASHTAPIFTLDYEPRGKLLAVAGSGPQLGVWDLRFAQPRLVIEVQAHDTTILNVSFSPSGKLVASCAWDGTVRLWRLSDGRKVGELVVDAFSVSCLAFSESGDQLAIGAGSGSICLWSTTGDGKVQRLGGDLLAGEIFDISSIAWLRGDATLAIGDIAGQLSIWDIDAGRKAIESRAHAGPVSGLVRIGSDRLVSCSHDDSVVLWDLAAREEVFQAYIGCDGIFSVAVRGKEDVIACGGSDGFITLLEVPTGKLVARWRAHDSEVSSLAFEDGGRRLFSGGADKMFAAWDLKGH